MLETLLLPPVLRGLAALILISISFPLVGVFVLRMKLVPLRFSLMHVTLFAGVVSLAFKLDPVWISLILDIGLVFLVYYLSKDNLTGENNVTIFSMVLFIGLSYLVIYTANVPAKNAFEVFWGNIYSLDWFYVLLTALYTTFVVFFVFFNFRKITAFLFHPDVALSVGVNIERLRMTVLFLVGLTIALAIKIIGALLVDALLLLPALCASLSAKSAKSLFVYSLIIGFISAVAGFGAAIALEIPVSTAVILISSFIFIILYIKRRLQ